jgi:site-specific DNA-methyltransferase (adenine-specific)
MARKRSPGAEHSAVSEEHPGAIFEASPTRRRPVKVDPATLVRTPWPEDRPLDVVEAGDCVAKLNALPAGSVDLVFADPPFNIGYDYDLYDDRKLEDEYLAWSRGWIAAVHRVLKPDGVFWLAIGDEYAAELKVLARREVGFHARSWVVWYYTFGVNCKRKFTRSHAHLFHFTKDAVKGTFNSEDPANRIPSARALVYGDRRANPAGRLPDDTWILRPQDIPDGFGGEADTWYYPRVAGTFKERAGYHGCQMPEQLLGRIIRFCSNPGEIVVDPFAGSCSTLITAKKLDRRFLGFDLSPDYVLRGNARLAEVNPGDPLVGSENPLTSAPDTASGRRLEDVADKPRRIRLVKRKPVDPKGRTREGV